MSKNVFKIIYIVLGKFKRKFFNKIQCLAIHTYMNQLIQTIISNKKNICYDTAAREVQKIVKN